MNTSFEHLLEENRKFLASREFSSHAHIGSFSQYLNIYQQSIENPDLFWLAQAETLHWFKKPTISSRHTWDYDKNIIEHSWFEDGILNVSFNCLDRHIQEGKGLKPAILWQGENDSETKILTFV